MLGERAPSRLHRTPSCFTRDGTPVADRHPHLASSPPVCGDVAADGSSSDPHLARGCAGSSNLRGAVR